MQPVNFEASPTARRDVSTGPSDALAEHHSYLEAILELQHRGHDVVHINAVHHLPFACAGLLSPAVVTATLHTPPTPWLESALHARRRSTALPSLVVGVACQRRRMVERRRPPGDPQRRRSRPVATRAGGDGAVWWGRLVPEKAPHLAIDAARRAGGRRCHADGADPRSGVLRRRGAAPPRRRRRLRRPPRGPGGGRRSSDGAPSPS